MIVKKPNGIINPKIVFYIWTIIVLTAVSLVSIRNSHKIIRSDGSGYYLPLRSFFIDGDFHYANEYANYDIGKPVPDSSVLRTETNHVPNKYFIGPAILWAPFFILAHLLTLFLNLFGAGLALDGYSPIYQLFIGYGSALYGLFGLLFIYKFLLLYFDQNVSIISVASLVLGTNIIYYLSVEPTMSHNCSLFAVSLFFYIWKKENQSKNYWAYLGIIIAIMTLIRPQNILFSVILIPNFLHLLKLNGMKGFLQVLQLPVLFMICFLPQIVVWKIIYGRFLVYSYGGESFNFTDLHMIESLFSPLHGLIQWTPLVGVGIIGLFLGWKKYTAITTTLFICFLLQWILNGAWHCWWFGMSYGNRAYINCSIIFAFGLAYLIKNYGKHKKLMITVISFLIIHNLLFFLAYSSNAFNNGEEISFIQSFLNHKDNMIKVYQSVLDFAANF